MSKILLALLLIACSAFAADLPEDLQALKRQFESDSRAALKPLVLKYAAQLDALHRAALQAGDAAKAILIEQEMATVQAVTKVEIPQSNLPGAVKLKPAVSSAIPAIQPVGRWVGENGADLVLHPNGILTAAWGQGHWTLEPGRPILGIQWDGQALEEWKIEGVTTIREGNGHLWKKTAK